MSNRVASFPHNVSTLLGAITLLGVAVLLLWDAAPDRFPAGAHDILAALPLGLIAVVWIVDRASRRSSRAVLVQASILSLAFLFWAANQFWPESPHATVFNDVAVALFVLDVWFTTRERRREAPSPVAQR